MNARRPREIDDDSDECPRRQRPRLDSGDSDSSFSNYVMPSMPMCIPSLDSPLSETDSVFTAFKTSPTPEETKPSYNSYCSSSGFSSLRSDDEEDPLRTSSFSRSFNTQSSTSEDPLDTSSEFSNNVAAGYSAVSVKMMVSANFLLTYYFCLY